MGEKTGKAKSKKEKPCLLEKLLDANACFAIVKTSDTFGDLDFFVASSTDAKKIPDCFQYGGLWEIHKHKPVPLITAELEKADRKLIKELLKDDQLIRVEIGNFAYAYEVPELSFKAHYKEIARQWEMYPNQFVNFFSKK